TEDWGSDPAKGIPAMPPDKFVLYTHESEFENHYGRSALEAAYRAWWTKDNQVNFLERMAGTPTYPYFDRGWWFWGNIMHESLTWNLAAFTGAGMELDYPKGDVDDHKDFFARLFFTPFKNLDDSPIQGLNLCVEGSTGKQSVPTKRFEQGGYGAAVRDDKYWT
ncbi:MAG: hypothetical protein ABIF77_03995, partial [bacterium]